MVIWGSCWGDPPVPLRLALLLHGASRAHAFTAQQSKAQPALEMPLF